MKFLICLIVTSVLSINANAAQQEVYRSQTLSVSKISDHVYGHTSYLLTHDFGKVPCNGMVVTDGGQAVVFDTTTDNDSSSELINWIKQELACEIIAVIPTHYHVDNLGGLDEFHRQRIPSYAYYRTIEIARENGLPVPLTGFDGFLELGVGKEKIYAEFLGEGHTCDNIIGYFPSEGIMFGGCLVKAAGSGKGSLKEANVGAWPETVRKAKVRYPCMKRVIPGHGESGGPELLDHTIDLFETENIM